MVDDETPRDRKIIVLDAERRRQLAPHLRKTKTRAYVRADQVWFVRGEGKNEETLLVMDIDAAFAVSGQISRAAADLRERRETTNEALAGMAKLMWCDAQGAPVYSYRHDVRVVDRDGSLVRVHVLTTEEARIYYYAPKGQPSLPGDDCWYDGASGYPVEKVPGRRFWRIVASWIPGTGKYTHW